MRVIAGQRLCQTWSSWLNLFFATATVSEALLSMSVYTSSSSASPSRTVKRALSRRSVTFSLWTELKTFSLHHVGVRGTSVLTNSSDWISQPKVSRPAMWNAALPRIDCVQSASLTPWPSISLTFPKFFANCPKKTHIFLQTNNKVGTAAQTASPCTTPCSSTSSSHNQWQPHGELSQRAHFWSTH